MTLDRYDMHRAATDLGKSVRWLQTFLREHPADVAGVPFYTPIGRTKEFTPSDIERIRVMLRELERCRLESYRREPEKAGSGQSAGRSPEGLLMRLQRQQTKKLLNNLRVVSK